MPCRSKIWNVSDQAIGVVVSRSPVYPVLSIPWVRVDYPGWFIRTGMYASFGTEPQVTLFDVIKRRIDVNAKNKKGDYGSEASRKMDFSDVDRAPMQVLNEIIWKSVKGVFSPMPPPVQRFVPLSMQAT